MDAGNLEPKETFEPQECWGLRRGRPHLVRDVNSATECAHSLNVSAGGTICVQMLGQGQPLRLHTWLGRKVTLHKISGHLTATNCSVLWVGYLKSPLRPADIPSYYGGEEFTLVLPGASCDIVRSRAETLRKRFRGIPFDRGSGIDKGQRAISLSFGVAVFPDIG
jgi:hypothetical protein